MTQISEHDQEQQGSENENVLRRYEKRRGRGSLYSPLKPDVVATRQEWERAVIHSLLARGIDDTNIAGLRVLDVGCGYGATLNFYMSLGVRPENLTGVDLIPERIESARKRLPAPVNLHVGDVAALEGDSCFDLINVSVVFSSVLSDDQRKAIAQRIWDLLRPGGSIICYDFMFNNPANPDVRKLTIPQLRAMFPAGRVSSKRITLAPPVARLATQIHPVLYPVLNCIWFLRTHRLTLISK